MFDSNRLQPDRAFFNDQSIPNCFAAHRYYSISDTINEILANPTFFPPYLGADSNAVKAGDYLILKDTTDNLTTLIKSIDSSGNVIIEPAGNGGIITTINHELPPAIVGPNKFLIGNYYNFGDLILAYYAAVTFNVGVASSLLLTVPIPDLLKPDGDPVAVNVVNPIVVTSNSLDDRGSFLVSPSSGTIQIGTWPNSTGPNGNFAVGPGQIYSFTAVWPNKFAGN